MDIPPYVLSESFQESPLAAPGFISLPVLGALMR